MNPSPQTDWPALLANGIGQALTACLAALLGAYLGTRLKYRAEYKDRQSRLAKDFATAYEQERGKRLATTEDIQNVLDQVRLVTKETEIIKAQIGQDQWLRQMVWGHKRETLMSLLKQTHRLFSCVSQLVVDQNLYLPKLQKLDITPAETVEWEKRKYENGKVLVEIINSFTSDLIEAEVFVGELTWIRSLFSGLVDCRVLSNETGPADRAKAIDIAREIHDGVRALAREKLGISSTESSASGSI